MAIETTWLVKGDKIPAELAAGAITAISAEIKNKFAVAMEASASKSQQQEPAPGMNVSPDTTLAPSLTASQGPKNNNPKR